MNLRVIKAGVLDTLQDMGRKGWQYLGINAGGAMDRLAAQYANLLVGNDRGEAVIEMHFPASTYFFEQPSLIAVTGADFVATVNGEELPRYRPVLVSRYSILQFHRAAKGARAYLAVHGGLDVPLWLNSRSTHLKAGIGGHQGRALQKDDEIRLRKPVDFCQMLDKHEMIVLPWSADPSRSEAGNSREVAVIPGQEWKRLTAESQRLFFDRAFRISRYADRMGYRLRGEPLHTETTEDFISSAVSFGTVQLLPDGQLTLLMADHQTAGGYPRMAHVITAHHSRLAQMKPGDLFIFRLTDQQTAEELLHQQEQHLLKLQYACRYRLDEWLQK